MAKAQVTHNIDTFVQRGVKFIQHFYANEATEFAQMMSPALAKVVSPPGMHYRAFTMTSHPK